jgi:hypothetical protein
MTDHIEVEVRGEPLVATTPTIQFFSIHTKPSLSGRRLLAVLMMRRSCGCRTVKRVKGAWLGNTVAMMHDRRIVNAGGRQEWHGHDR